MNPVHPVLALHDQLRQQLAAAPGNPDLIADLAGVLAQMGRQAEAFGQLLPAIKVHPRHIGLRHNLAELYRNTGDLPQGEALFLRLLDDAPDFFPAYASLLQLYERRLASPELSPAQRAALQSQLAKLACNQGNALLAAGQIEAAEAAFRRSLHYWATYPTALSNLSNVRRSMGQPGEAENLARQAVTLQPGFAAAWNNLGVALSELGQFDEAATCYQRALALDSALDEARHNAGSGSLMMLLYRDEVDAPALLAAHAGWGRQFPAPDCGRGVASGGRLRVGFISADFREHAVMYFVEGLLEHLDRTRFEVFCYANQTLEDAVTRRIKALPLHWRPVIRLSDAELCTQIAHDGIDVLIDLSGHSRGHRLYALAHKPAPVMATWMGYLNSVGLPAIEYRISDRQADPEPLAAQWHTEKLVYLNPSQFAYRPRDTAPAVNALPALTGGQVTFGSLNSTQKINRSVAATWARILKAVPDSRLLLQQRLLADPYVAGWLRGLFDAHGVDRRRLDFRPYSVQHLQTYGEIDIALDTFPYSGGATTCEALWMGAPVISLAGDRSIGRSGTSILGAAGLADWCASSHDGYADLAIQRSADLTSLANLRQRLRQQLRTSALCDQKSFALDFARCLNLMAGRAPR